MRMISGAVLIVVLAVAAGWFFLAGPGAGGTIGEDLRDRLGNAGVVPTATPTTRLLKEFRKEISAGTIEGVSLGWLRRGERIYGSVEALTYDINVYLADRENAELILNGEPARYVAGGQKIDNFAINHTIGQDDDYFLILDKRYALFFGTDVAVRLELETPAWVNR